MSFKHKTLPVKQCAVRESTIYAINNIDDEVIDEFSEFLIASLTKMFTAVVIFILHGLKLLNVNDQVSKYVTSEFDLFETITILQLLNHEAGFKTLPSSYEALKYRSATQVFDKYNKESYIVFPVGQFRYASWGYVLLGRIIEQVTRGTYAAAYKKYITDPLEMTQTRVGDTNITLYTVDKELEPKEFNERYFACSSGGLYSTMNDMQKFAAGVWGLVEGSEALLKNTYFCSVTEEKIILKHGGLITGGTSSFFARYDPRTFELVKFKATLQTCCFP